MYFLCAQNTLPFLFSLSFPSHMLLVSILGLSKTLCQLAVACFTGFRASCVCICVCENEKVGHVLAREMIVRSPLKQPQHFCQCEYFSITEMYELLCVLRTKSTKHGFANVSVAGLCVFQFILGLTFICIHLRQWFLCLRSWMKPTLRSPGRPN